MLFVYLIGNNGIKKQTYKINDNALSTDFKVEKDFITYESIKSYSGNILFSPPEVIEGKG